MHLPWPCEWGPWLSPEQDPRTMLDARRYCQHGFAQERVIPTRDEILTLRLTDSRQ